MNKMWMILVCVVALVTPVWADAPTLAFLGGNTDTPGTLNWYRLDFQSDLSVCPSPVCAIATGQQIPMVLLQATDTPANEGNYPLTGTNLQFTTGAYLNTIDGVMNFGPGGHLQIYGTVPGILGAGPGLLLNGTFDSATYVPDTREVTLFTASGSDSKNQHMVNFFYPDIPPRGWNFQAAILSTPSSPDHTLWTGGEIVEAAVVENAEIPEPASIVFLGTALLGLATVVRRRWA